MYRSVMLLLALTFSPNVVAAQQPCTSDARQVVNELYRHMLERGADSGSVHWQQQLENGRMTVRDVVREIAKSNEHTQRFWRQEAGEERPYFRAVGTIYRHLLGRQPDAGGARSWAEVGVNNGVGAVVDSIATSREYDEQFGDWGVPGSGGLRFCGTGVQSSTQPSAAVNNADRRFRGMDTNKDGTITFAEWRGNRRAFDNQDWNRDGVLSGDEVRPGATRAGRTVENGNPARDNTFDDLDANGNNRIEPREWRGSVAAFTRLDVNNDNFLTRVEMTDSRVGARAVPTSGHVVNVDSGVRWTDTGINVQGGYDYLFDASGSVQLSNDRNDLAGPGGASSGRKAPSALMPQHVAGALIARMGNEVIFIGDRRSIRAPYDGRLYLGVNDDHLGDNSGHFQVMVTEMPPR